MIPTIEKSEKFQEEISTYNQKIMSAADEQTKKEATMLLKSLIVEIKKIDRYHENILETRSLPSAVNDCRLKATEIRKKLHQLLS